MFGLGKLIGGAVRFALYPITFAEKVVDKITDDSCGSFTPLGDAKDAVAEFFEELDDE